MKRIVIFGLLLLIAACAFSQTILYRDQATLQWDAVTVDINGDPFLPEDVVEYEVFIYDSALTINDQIVANLIPMGTTMATELLCVFPERKNWYAGVRTKVTTGEPVTTYSTIAWSYDPGVVSIDGPFAYAPLGGAAPIAPDNLRDSGT